MKSEESPGAWATLKRTAREFREGQLTDWAAALTYYGLLSLFPALIAMVSLLGLFGDPKTTIASVTEVITSIGPDSAAQTFEGPIDSVVSDQRAAGFAFVLGLAVGTVVGFRLHRRLHARLQRHLRNPRGPPVLEAATAVAGGDAGDGLRSGPARA